MPSRILAVFLLAISAAPFCQAQTAEADLQSQLVGKKLFLRGLWSTDDLKFAADGTPAGVYATGPFTGAGFVARNVSVKGSTLHVEGVREAIEIDRQDKMIWVTVPAGKMFGDKGEKVTIDIDGNGQDFAPALKAVFAEDITELVPSMPSFWQQYAREKWLNEPKKLPDRNRTPCRNADSTEKETTPPGCDPEKPMKAAGVVKPPKVEHTVEPAFSIFARRIKYTGSTEVYMIVDEQGLPQKVRIVRPLGLGLDEQAVAAVSQYRFHPATLNGKPVKVDMYVDINFTIF